MPSCHFFLLTVKLLIKTINTPALDLLINLQLPYISTITLHFTNFLFLKKILVLSGMCVYLVVGDAAVPVECRLC